MFFRNALVFECLSFTIWHCCRDRIGIYFLNGLIGLQAVVNDLELHGLLEVLLTLNPIKRLTARDAFATNGPLSRRCSVARSSPTVPCNCSAQATVLIWEPSKPPSPAANHTVSVNLLGTSLHFAQCIPFISGPGLRNDMGCLCKCLRTCQCLRRNCRSIRTS